METHFNATKLIPIKNGVRILKPAHFLDNLKVQAILKASGKEAVITKGRNGGTMIPNELWEIFKSWVVLNKK